MRHARVRTLGILVGSAALLSGCVTRTNDRRIVVTSDPPGATVWLNDVEIGRTPTEASFKFYGTYDLQLRLDGYQPVHEGRTAHAPLHEQPGLDLIAAAWPWRPRHEVTWHFDLEPTPERTLGTEELETQLIERARQAAAMAAGDADEPAEPEQSGSESSDAGARPR